MSDSEPAARGTWDSPEATSVSPDEAPAFAASLDGRETLPLNRDDANIIVDRLRETKVDITGRAFLLKLDTLIVRLGS